MRRAHSPARIQRAPRSIEEILNWADAWFAKHKKWPNINSGKIPATRDDTWRRIDDSLRNGLRGLPRGKRLSLARLLAKRRGARNSEFPPQLTENQIIRWARLHRKRTGH